MSLDFSKKDVLFLQRILAVSGFYAGPLDGKFNKDMDKAETRFDERFAKIRDKEGAFDSRSEKNIMTMLPVTQTLARRFLAAVSGFDLTAKIISGTRTYAEQDALFAIGRTVQKHRNPVTKARGGQSNHNFSIAWDVGLFDKKTGAFSTKDKPYKDLAAIVKANVTGLEWGGDWKGFVDVPHYEVASDKKLSEIRKLFEAGTPFV